MFRRAYLELEAIAFLIACIYFGHQAVIMLWAMIWGKREGKE
jgi:hypothetical protein